MKTVKINNQGKKHHKRENSPIKLARKHSQKTVRKTLLSNSHENSPSKQARKQRQLTLDSIMNNLPGAEGM